MGRNPPREGSNREKSSQRRRKCGETLTRGSQGGLKSLPGTRGGRGEGGGQPPALAPHLKDLWLHFS